MTGRLCILPEQLFLSVYICIYFKGLYKDYAQHTAFVGYPTPHHGHLTHQNRHAYYYTSQPWGNLNRFPSIHKCIYPFRISKISHIGPFPQEAPSQQVLFAGVFEDPTYQAEALTCPSQGPLGYLWGVGDTSRAAASQPPSPSIP